MKMKPIKMSNIYKTYLYLNKIVLCVWANNTFPYSYRQACSRPKYKVVTGILRWRLKGLKRISWLR